MPATSDGLHGHRHEEEHRADPDESEAQHDPQRRAQPGHGRSASAGRAGIAGSGGGAVFRIHDVSLGSRRGSAAEVRLAASGPGARA